MRTPTQVIQKPLLTEKGTRLKEEANQYLFRVNKRANKVEIKKAIEELFKVTVVDVRTLPVQGKAKRLGRFQGKMPDWKKAIATLKEGDSIELYEGV
ncbi:MAG TPA: 50S ribosomal protein L23 [Candidatus Baltobacteraceae bacterium]|nr:50S ribosomal protein L23 [Candidatus Baltobacteraceae bacterium]